MRKLFIYLYTLKYICIIFFKENCIISVNSTLYFVYSYLYLKLNKIIHKLLYKLKFNHWFYNQVVKCFIFKTKQKN